MAVCNYNSFNRINTKDELLLYLKKYKGILSKSMYYYLLSLIYLEISVIKDYIPNNDRETLSELDIYKKIAIYNIYNRSIKTMNKCEFNYNVYNNSNGIEGIIFNTNIDNKTIKLFEFDYKEEFSDDWSIMNIPNGFKSMKIGNISLYQSFDGSELKEIEKQNIIYNINKLYSESKSDDFHQRIIYEKQIEEYKKRLELLSQTNEVNNLEIEITNKVLNLFLMDYGLEGKLEEDITVKDKYIKKYIKKLNNLSIENNIKYI